jgi:hypothetical protein
LHIFLQNGPVRLWLHTVHIALENHLNDLKVLQQPII